MAPIASIPSGPWPSPRDLAQDAACQSVRKPAAVVARDQSSSGSKSLKLLSEVFPDHQPFIPFFLSSLPIPANRWMPSGNSLSALSGGQPKRPLRCLSLAACRTPGTRDRRRHNTANKCTRLVCALGGGAVAPGLSPRIRMRHSEQMLLSLSWFRMTPPSCFPWEQLGGTWLLPAGHH